MQDEVIISPDTRRPKRIPPNLPLAEFRSGAHRPRPLCASSSEDSLVALTHDGEPLTLAHGAPARLIVPQLCAWKSAKWLRALECLSTGPAGFWERNGYHRHGDPWQEERFGS